MYNAIVSVRFCITFEGVMYMRTAIEIMLFPLWLIYKLFRIAFWGIVILTGFVV